MVGMGDTVKTADMKMFMVGQGWEYPRDHAPLRTRPRPDDRAGDVDRPLRAHVRESGGRSVEGWTKPGTVTANC